MKRFTDCNKWDDPWYCELSPENRSFYEYLLDRSDQVGMWKINKRMAEFCIQAQIDLEGFLKIAGKRIQVYNSESWWIVGYCKFQYGELKESCKPHLKYIKMLSDYGLLKRVSKGYSKGIDTLQEKEEDKDKDKKKEEEMQEKVKNIMDHYLILKPAKFDTSRGQAKKNLAKLLETIPAEDLMESVRNYEVSLQAQGNVGTNYAYNSGNFFGRDSFYLGFLPGSEGEAPKPLHENAKVAKAMGDLATAIETGEKSRIEFMEERLQSAKDKENVN